MPELIVHGGSCHCGAVQVTFRASRPLSEFALRRCDCSFCRRHGARTVADPAGRVKIRTRPGALWRYRFGLRITDMLLCRECGVYIAALIVDEGRAFATVNANALEVRDALDPAPPLASYGHESVEERLARRLANWTPATVTETDA